MDAVIVALGRTPIGRARKGSLVDVRPDDLAAHVVTKVLEVPELDRSDIPGLICGCGLPGGERSLIGRSSRYVSPRCPRGYGQPVLLIIRD
jgi:acetyl-CoA acetyltransferase